MIEQRSNNDFYHNNPYAYNDDDSISSNSSQQDDSDNSSQRFSYFFDQYKMAIISSCITLLLIIITISVAAGVHSEIRMHVVEKTIEIVNKTGGYIIWSVHCIGLLMLPFLFIYLFDDIQIYYIFAPPVMMLLNMISCFIPIKGTFYPLIIELIISIFLLFHLPFKGVYLPGKHYFLAGEMALMFLSFIYISTSLGSSTLTYILYGSYIRVNNRFLSYPSNPHYAIDYIHMLKSNSYFNVIGEYLSCYSLFSLLMVGIGFAMSLKNSIFMSVPFFILCVCTFLETRAIGVLLLCQLSIHIIYIIILHIDCLRKYEAGCIFKCCYECCYATVTTIMCGDLIGFLLFAFPILQLTIYKDGDHKFNWGGFIGGSIFITFAIVLHVSFIIASIFPIAIVAGIGFFIASIIFGILFAGYVPFIRVFTYEVTYLTWSFALCFWSYSNGYSPTLFKIYNALIPVASLVMIELYEGVGWMEILFAIIQIIFDVYIITIIQKEKTNFLAWTAFSVAGIIALGFLMGTAIAIGAGIVLSILYFCCCNSGGDGSGVSAVTESVESHVTSLVIIEYECVGVTYASA